MELGGHSLNPAEMLLCHGTWEHLFVCLQALPLTPWMTLASLSSGIKWWLIMELRLKGYYENRQIYVKQLTECQAA